MTRSFEPSSEPRARMSASALVTFFVGYSLWAVVELGRLLRISTDKDDVTLAATDVESLLVVKFIDLVAHLHAALATDIEDADLAACGEVRSLQRVDGLEQEFLLDRHGTADNHAVVHRINQVDFILRENFLNQKVAAQTLGVVTFSVLGMRCITDFIVRFHTY